MTLVLRKCWSDGHSSDGFYYGKKGDVVASENLYGLKEGNGDWGLLEGDIWLVFEVKGKIVDYGDKCKFKTGKILFRGSTKQLSKSEFPKKLKLNEESAFQWALNIGNKNIMSKKIKSEQCAYEWAKYIGNKSEMIKKIKSEDYAYLWVFNFGDENKMIKKIKSKFYVREWNLRFKPVIES